MASKQEATLPLTFWVDREKNRVVMAEASGDFVDVLFSFLTLPLGTIIRLVSKNLPDPPLEMGCINNLYQSVQNSSADVFWNHICKQMLLSPRNSFKASCQRLKLNVDDTEPTKYFICSSCSKRYLMLLSTFAGASCSCGKLMSKEMKSLEESEEEAAGGNGVFVKGDAMFLIFDDLRVIQSSPINSVQQLLQLGYKDFSKITEMSLNVGMKEVFSILKQALTSKSPLSDVLLAKGESKPTYSFSPDTTGSNDHYYCDNKIKITVSKSQNKILFAEAGGHFIDFLFSFLTTPLGSILKLRNGKLSMGCIDNLHTSVKNLDSAWFIGSSNNSLLNPRVADRFGCQGQLLNVSEEDTPSYWYGTVIGKANIRREMISNKKERVSDPAYMKLFDPRSSDGAREYAVGFVKRPCLFVVWDDLHVTPVTTTSSLSFLQKLNVPFDDLEEHLVEIRTSQALNLLEASLTSKAALTESLFFLLERPKEESQRKKPKPEL